MDLDNVQKENRNTSLIDEICKTMEFEKMELEATLFEAEGALSWRPEILVVKIYLCLH